MLQQTSTPYPYKDLGETFAVIANAHEKGVILPEAIAQGINVTKNNDLNAALQAMIDGWNKEQNIIVPMKKHENIFPEMFIQMTEIGFQTQNLASVWKQLSVACTRMANSVSS